MMTKLEIAGAMPDPTEPGIYACEVYHGWKLLEWGPCNMWFHVGLQAGKYPLEVVQWVGPMPREIYWALQDQKPGTDYDL